MMAQEQKSLRFSYSPWGKHAQKPKSTTMHFLAYSALPVKIHGIPIDLTAQFKEWSRHPRPTLLPTAMEHILSCPTPILPYLMHSVFFGFECACSGENILQIPPRVARKARVHLVFWVSHATVSPLNFVEVKQPCIQRSRISVNTEETALGFFSGSSFHTESFFPCKRCFRINLYVIIARSLSLSAFSRSIADICFRFLVFGGPESSVAPVCLSNSVFVSVSCEIREWRSSGFVPWKRIMRQKIGSEKRLLCQ